MSTVLIKEVNNQPVIFNVDNATDAARLEALQAVKMSESMAAEIFGDNIKYADNTTCIITDNPDNAEFPYTVVFDSSKIPEKPKRNMSRIAECAMPSNQVINIPITLNADKFYTAPANGYAYLHFGTGASGSFSVGLTLSVQYNNKIILAAKSLIKDVSWNGTDSFVPVRKGQTVFAKIDVSGNYPKPNYIFRFVYAKGEI